MYEQIDRKIDRQAEKGGERERDTLLKEESKIVRIREFRKFFLFLRMQL